MIRKTQYIGSGVRSPAWEPACDVYGDPPTVADVTPNDWVRLIPASGFEGAAPRRSPLVVDRKITPAFDLAGGLTGWDLVASERLVRALEHLGARGWSAKEALHVTSNVVSGNALYVLDLTGFVGPFVDTALEPTRSPQTPSDDDRVLRGVPMGPVTFDGARGTGDDVCATPWIGLGSARWRGLIVRGEVYLGLVDRIGPLALGAERVTVKAVAPRRARPGGVVVGDAREPRPKGSPASIASIVLALRANAKEHAHLLPAGASARALEEVTASSRFPLPAAYAEFLRACDGAELFGGSAFSFFRASGDERGTVAHACTLTRGEDSEYLADDEWLPFAEAQQGRVVWAIDRHGIVHGLGNEQVIFGPQVPFAVWLADQIADLTWATAHRDESVWAKVTLGG